MGTIQKIIARSCVLVALLLTFIQHRYLLLDYNGMLEMKSTSCLIMCSIFVALVLANLVYAIVAYFKYKSEEKCIFKSEVGINLLSSGIIFVLSIVPYIIAWCAYYYIDFLY